MGNRNKAYFVWDDATCRGNWATFPLFRVGRIFHIYHIAVSTVANGSFVFNWSNLTVTGLTNL